jgi:adenosylcobinamide-GDP ribazoletransferase
VLNGGRHRDETSPRGLGRRLVVALQFLTRLPTPPLKDVGPADFSRSSVFFPLVGGVIGGCVVLAVMLGGMINAAVAGLGGVLVWVAVTGGLHLDGLGDVADGFGAAHGDPERFRAVLHDPHVGSFAVIAIALQIAAKLVLLASIATAGQLWPLVLIPAWARWGALVWARAMPALWSGTGERFAAGTGWLSIALWGTLLAVPSAWLAPNLLAALVIVPAALLFWRWRLGGISGDCLGASIEITETLLLLALLVRTA